MSAQGRGHSPRINGEAERDVVAELRGWLGSGPVQADSGAFFAWVDERTGEGSFEYPEITGYALTYLAGRGDLGDGELSRARRAADWLAERLERGELRARAGWDGDATYSFDLAMISTGLICFGRRLEGKRHLEAGLELASLLAEDALAPGGLGPILGSASPSSRRGWSAEGRPHLAKAVQCLLAAAQEGLATGRQAAARLIEEVGSMQGEDGSFRTQPGSAGVMLHAHLYAAEGLWIWATSQSDSGAAARARRATDWAWEQQLGSGGFPRSVGTPEGGVEIEQCDASAQAVRMAASPSPGGAALVYQPGAAPVHHNSWTSMFGAQALEWVDSGPSEWTTLI